uniref:Uncharacterized protein n=1 Tax=Chromera velia CCMP2878 TaxID=1169474 RepID=A0A0G4F8N7_9ALVE|eukprot:Cvel_15789.t1-p1 / transcript=Cvel_15789.t1 / gene=Cvel_15789 / organism=Chromera_velia_CCMP2878 / gene_product=hypothetical protein / transcript_product=hypothetical protein / location=Cvel_scaffold1185:17297-19409(-) / protein_length=229 / sequence_SO=supercontig / SO=protein_coding / is_pseudo=false
MTYWAVLGRDCIARRIAGVGLNFLSPLPLPVVFVWCASLRGGVQSWSCQGRIWKDEQEAIGDKERQLGQQGEEKRREEKRRESKGSTLEGAGDSESLEFSIGGKRREETGRTSPSPLLLTSIFLSACLWEHECGWVGVRAVVRGLPDRSSERASVFGRLRVRGGTVEGDEDLHGGSAVASGRLSPMKRRPRKKTETVQEAQGVEGRREGGREEHQRAPLFVFWDHLAMR